MVILYVLYACFNFFMITFWSFPNRFVRSNIKEIILNVVLLLFHMMRLLDYGTTNTEVMVWFPGNANTEKKHILNALSSHFG